MGHTGIIDFGPGHRVCESIRLCSRRLTEGHQGSQTKPSISPRISDARTRIEVTAGARLRCKLAPQVPAVPH